MTEPPALYHAASRADWAARSATHYEPQSVATEGFVHCSDPAQLVDTLHRHYLGRDDLLLIRIDPGASHAELIREDLSDSGTEFPHLYGPIELTAVVEVVPLPCDADGRFDWWRPGPPVVAHRATPATATVHALLDQLAAAGFDGAPIPLWRRAGLEAVSYLTGEVAADGPWPAAALDAVGRLLGAAHAASESFAGRAGRVMNHGSLGPEKVIWRDGRPVGLTDWRRAGLGPPERDLTDVATRLCHGDDGGFAAFISGYREQERGSVPRGAAQ